MGLRIVAGSGAPGPIPPPTLPDIGVAGIEHRWHALMAVTSIVDGTTVTSWPDAITSSPLNLTRSVYEAGSPEPQFGLENGHAHVAFAGIDMASATQLTPPHSYWLVFSTSVLGKPVFRSIGIETSRNPSGGSPGRIRLQFGSSPVVSGDIHSNTNGWQTVIVAANPAGGSQCMINGVLLAPSGGTYTALGSSGPNAPTHLMGDGASGGTNVGKVRDHGSFTGLLSSDQMTTIYNALKAAYSDIV